MPWNWLSSLLSSAAGYGTQNNIEVMSLMHKAFWAMVIAWHAISREHALSTYRQFKAVEDRRWRLIRHNRAGVADRCTNIKRKSRIEVEKLRNHDDRFKHSHYSTYAMENPRNEPGA